MSGACPLGGTADSDHSALTPLSYRSRQRLSTEMATVIAAGGPSACLAPERRERARAGA